MKEFLIALTAMLPVAAVIGWALFRLPVGCGFGRRCGAVVVLPLRGHMEDAEYRIRGTAAWARGAAVYVVNCGADEETAEIAARLCEEIPSVYWVDAS